MYKTTSQIQLIYQSLALFHTFHDCCSIYRAWSCPVCIQLGTTLLTAMVFSSPGSSLCIGENLGRHRVFIMFLASSLSVDSARRKSSNVSLYFGNPQLSLAADLTSSSLQAAIMMLVNTDLVPAVHYHGLKPPLNSALTAQAASRDLQPQFRKNQNLLYFLQNSKQFAILFQGFEKSFTLHLKPKSLIIVCKLVPYVVSYIK